MTVMLSACGQVGGSATPSAPQGAGTITNPATDYYKPLPLLWESQNKNGVMWSAFAYQIIGNDVAADLLPGSQDMPSFCPAYDQLTDLQKVNFWGYLISAIAKYASNFSPVAQAEELGRGLDAITGAQTIGQGLLQLAYQDVITYNFCSFDWNQDRLLPPQDSQRTINNPIRNLDCGIKILATQISASKRIADASSYWIQLRAGVIGNRLAEIKKLTSSLPFCHIH